MHAMHMYKLAGDRQIQLRAAGSSKVKQRPWRQRWADASATRSPASAGVGLVASRADAESRDKPDDERTRNEEPARRPFATALGVLLVVVTAGCSTAADDTNTQPASETAAADDDPVLAAAYQFLEDYSDGDVDAVLGRMDETGQYSNVIYPGDWPFNVTGYQDVAEFIAWTVAAGTKVIEPHCVVEPDPLTTTVDCALLWDNAVRRAVGALPLPGGVLMTFDEDQQIVAFEGLTVVRGGRSPFAEFGEWLSQAHPDDLEAGTQPVWDSIEEAIESGRIRAEHLDEWVASLQS